ncbi:MAG: asparagine synthetase B [Saprospiraceae bacterium]|nr:asparagine synthetase B [Saprospiraceae bacterium]
MKKQIQFFVLTFCYCCSVQAAYILLPMDLAQKDHLKAYGITYWVLSKDVEAHWLLNYRGGSFAFPHQLVFEKECKTRGVSYEVVSDAQFKGIQQEIQNPEINMEDMKLEVAPKIAVYTPDADAKGRGLQRWDDAVLLVLRYAEIPFDMIYDKEVLEGQLYKYNWLHLHHEDFTGQHGRMMWRGGTNDYEERKKKAEILARSFGFAKVSQCKLAVAKKIKDFALGGGFMFAMCSATESFDVALAAEGTDICAAIFDGDGVDPNAQSKLDFSKTFAFQDFTVFTHTGSMEFSTVDNSLRRSRDVETDYFFLFDFSAKWDPVPTMLTQNHTKTIKGFMGQTTSFKKTYVKPHVLVLGDTKPFGENRYIHGGVGQGFFSFYGGHDPEDYMHRHTDPDTDLALHPNSPGYRLILNNILFPAAKKKKRKT